MSILALPKRNKMIKPNWWGNLGLIESTVRYNCRKKGMPAPVLAVPMWEGAGNKIYDYSGNGNHGSFINSPIWDENATKFIFLSSQYINMGTNPSLVLNDTSFTLSARVKLKDKVTSAELLNPIISMGGGGTDGKRFGVFYEYVTGSTTRYHGEIDDNIVKVELDTTIYATPGVWETVVFVRNYQSTLSIYVDGVLIGSIDDTSGDLGDLNGLPLLVGGYENTLGGGVTKFFDGHIKNAYIYNSALTPTQIKFISDNPYFMFEMPEELWGYTAAAGGEFNAAWARNSNQLIYGVFQ